MRKFKMEAPFCTPSTLTKTTTGYMKMQATKPMSII